MVDSYDFIIVGGGTAGLVVASRLSEDEGTSVLVLEAGPDLTMDPRVSVPLFSNKLYGSEVDWQFRTKPQPSLKDRVLGLNQGKGLGGSSAINAQIFVPPTKGEIDAWETLGNPGWNWSSLMGYLTKAYSVPHVAPGAKETLAIEHWPGLNAAGGPVKTSFGDTTHPIRRAWFNYFHSRGQAMTQDPFTRSSVGAFSCLASDDADGRRSFSAPAYFGPARHRPNLHVMTGVHVEKILLETNDRGTKAVGVRFNLQGAIATAKANREVILSAGTLQSPKILELSGIGSPEILREHGIDVKVDLPGVGQNFHDHPGIYAQFPVNDDVETSDAIVRQEPEALNKAMQEYLDEHSGPLTSLGVYTYAYLPLIGQEQADIETLLVQHNPKNSQHPSIRQEFYDVAYKTMLDSNHPSAAYLTSLGQTNFARDLRNDTIPPPSPGKFLDFVMMLSQPLSRGSVHIASVNPKDPPLIDPGYLSHPFDVEVLARHFLHIKPIVQSSEMSDIVQHPVKSRDPAADLSDLESAKTFMADNVCPMWHLVGTCSMLPREKDGVVDSRLRVYGVEGLRVVDASAIPLVSAGNLQSTVYAFAEKAADLIKTDWTGNSSCRGSSYQV